MDMMRTGLNGVLSAKAAMNIHAENVANAGNGDFTKRTGTFSCDLPGGVRFSETVQRPANFVVKSLSQTAGTAAFFESKSSWLETISKTFLQQSESVAKSLSELDEATKTFAVYPNEMNGEMATKCAKTLVESANAFSRGYDEKMADMKFSAMNVVEELNMETRYLAKLNDAISSGDVSNDILDKRDSSIKRVSELTGGYAVISKNGIANIFVGGYPIVSSLGENRMSVREHDGFSASVVSPEGMHLKNIGGKLGGILETMNETNVSWGTATDEMATFLDKFSAMWANGTDMDGNSPGAPFSVTRMTTPSTNNGGNAEIEITGESFYGTLSYLSGIWTGKTESGIATLPNDVIPILSSGVIQDGDTFFSAPSDTFPLEFSASSFPGGRLPHKGPLDASNALALSDLIENAGLSMKLSTSALNLSSNAASQSNMAKMTQTALSDAESSIDAFKVNLDEEAGKLLFFQQLYQSSSKVVSISQDLFDEFLSAIR